MAIKFYQAADFSIGRNGQKIQIICIHSMENQELGGQATQVAKQFSSAHKNASAHYFVDNKTIAQSVLEKDTAWAVGDQYLNRASISIEHSGKASQTLAEWNDKYSKPELVLSSTLTADIAKRYGIAPIRLTKSQILSILKGNKTITGFCGHNDISAALKNGGHWDPGKNFPWAPYLAQVSTKMKVK